MTSFFKKSFILIFLAHFIIGCASEAEKEARRNYSFDLSGSYNSKTAPNNSESEIDINFEIRNKSSRSDIEVSLTRTASKTIATKLSQKEQDVLKERLIAHSNINDSKTTDYAAELETIYNHFFSSPLILGKYDNKSHINGGKNISDDFGKSSSFIVCSDTLSFTNTKDKKPFDIYYCLDGTIKKQEKILSGNLNLHISEKQIVLDAKTKQPAKDKDGKDVIEHITSLAQLRYVSHTSLVFYKQHIGNWNGTVEYLFANDKFTSNSSLVLEIIELPINKTFYVKPHTSSPTFTDKTPLSNIQYSGETYTFNQAESEIQINMLMAVDTPVIQAVYTNSSKTKRIIFLGEIHGLGNLSGSVILVDGGSEILSTRLATKLPLIIATFKLVKADAEIR